MNTYMLKNKKSQLSITMIIAAIIGLIILVVIVLMLTGKLGIFGEETESATEGYIKICTEMGGSQLQGRTGGCMDHEDKIISKDALPGSGKNCCRCKTWDGTQCA